MDLSLPRCRLSYQKIVQIESNGKFKNAVLWICHCRDAACLIKTLDLQSYFCNSVNKIKFVNSNQ